MYPPYIITLAPNGESPPTWPIIERVFRSQVDRGEVRHRRMGDRLGPRGSRRPGSTTGPVGRITRRPGIPTRRSIRRHWMATGSSTWPEATGTPTGHHPELRRLAVDRPVTSPVRRTTTRHSRSPPTGRSSRPAAGETTAPCRSGRAATWTTVSLSAPVNTITRVSVAPGGTVYGVGSVAGNQSVLIRQPPGSRSATVIDPPAAEQPATSTGKTGVVALGLDVWLLGEDEPHDGWHHSWITHDDSGFVAAIRRMSQVAMRLSSTAPRSDQPCWPGAAARDRDSVSRSKRSSWCHRCGCDVSRPRRRDGARQQPGCGCSWLWPAGGGRLRHDLATRDIRPRPVKPDGSLARGYFAVSACAIRAHGRQASPLRSANRLPSPLPAERQALFAPARYRQPPGPSGPCATLAADRRAAGVGDLARSGKPGRFAVAERPCAMYPTVNWTGSAPGQPSLTVNVIVSQVLAPGWRTSSPWTQGLRQCAAGRPVPGARGEPAKRKHGPGRLRVTGTGDRLVNCTPSARCRRSAPSTRRCPG